MMDVLKFLKLQIHDKQYIHVFGLWILVPSSIRVLHAMLGDTWAHGGHSIGYSLYLHICYGFIDTCLSPVPATNLVIASNCWKLQTLAFTSSRLLFLFSTTRISYFVDANAAMANVVIRSMYCFSICSKPPIRPLSAGQAIPPDVFFACPYSHSVQVLLPVTCLGNQAQNLCHVWNDAAAVQTGRMTTFQHLHLLEMLEMVTSFSKIIVIQSKREIRLEGYCVAVDRRFLAKNSTSTPTQYWSTTIVGRIVQHICNDCFQTLAILGNCQRWKWLPVYTVCLILPSVFQA